MTDLLTPRDWQAIAQQKALELAGTPEAAEKLAESKRYGALADELDRLRADGSFIASRLEDRTNETGNLRDKLEIANIHITLLRAEVEALKALQEMALSSRTGVTIQYLNIPPEDGEPRLVGFRVMRFHYQGPVMPTMLEAIDAARKLIPTNNTKD